MIKPNPLKAGSKVGVISPSRFPTPELLETFKIALEKMGFQPVIHPQNSLTYGQLAGPDEARTAAIMDMFKDPSIEGIFCARGGIGANRLLEKLDYDIIKANPKVFCGFSDITVLLNAFAKQCGLVSFHGPVGWAFLDPHKDLATNMFKSLTGQMTNITQNYAQTECLRAGSAEGKLIGGNLRLLQHLVGTPYDNNPDGCILFIEDVEERWSAFDRSLHHYAAAGKFKNIKALIVGELTDMAEEKFSPWAEDYRDTLITLVPPHIPICVNYPCGHGKLLTTFPMGTNAALNITAKQTDLTLTENPFS